MRDIKGFKVIEGNGGVVRRSSSGIRGLLAGVLSLPFVVPRRVGIEDLVLVIG